MKLHKFISSSIVAIALLGVTLSGANVNAGINTDGNNNTKSDTPKMSRTGTNGSASMSKQAKVDIRDGYLTLDSVPQLNFNSNGNDTSNSANLPLNSSIDNGTLRVTDYRNVDNTNSPQGWTLTPSLGDFYNDSSNDSDGNNDGNNDVPWVMHLSNNNFSNNKGSTPNTNSPSLTAGSPGQTFIENSSGNKGYGMNTIKFGNNSNMASLDIPNVQQGSYHADLNWNLSAIPTSGNTGT